MSITFKVSNNIGSNKFVGEEFTHKQLYAGTRGVGKPEGPEKKIVRTSIKEGVSKSVGGNSFVQSAFLAYSNHHNLTIRPDDIWMAILVQFSLYLNANAEQLRNKIVDFEGKKQLEVRGFGTLMTANYQDLTIRMTKEIEKNIKDPSIREWANGPFSTTTPNDTMAASIALMATVKSFFEFKMSLMCGLPELTLLGTVDDWVNVKNRVEKLKEFDFKGNKDGGCMKSWTELLSPIINEIIDSVNGKPDLQWWNRIANQEGGGSGPRYISGWITAFCVFNNDGKWMGKNNTRTEMFGGQLKHNTEWIFVDTNEIPKGFLFVPVKIDDNGTPYETEFFAGHMAVTSDDPYSIQPNIDWCILV
ncbi:hypothetical protein RB653_006374 [Dictyostelium firmibasis]|uniref:Uncharacterized protein n=1 Tax=Dictyostelium firmibasis TaxID=79012 RepID=A0AAN7U981_9MYCE